MKKFFLAATLGVMMLTSSCKKAPEQETSTKAKPDSLMSPDSAASEVYTDNITLDTAARFISNFLTENKLLRNLGSGRAIGGILELQDFPTTLESDSSAGVNMWFGYSAFDSNFPTLFLGVEPTTKLEMNQTGPKKDIKIPGIGATFPYSGSKTDPATIKHYLQTESPGEETVRSIKLDKVKASKHLREFSQLHTPITPGTGGRYCDRPFSFFQNNTIQVLKRDIPYGLHAFLNQPGIKYVRYYFGYEKHNLAKPHNKIRVILIAVDALGNNIISATKSAPIILQKSVPPDR